MPFEMAIGKRQLKHSRKIFNNFLASSEFLPHDFVIEGEFMPETAVKTDALKRGKVIYIKHFPLAASDRGKRIHLEFNGVYRNCQIFMEGHLVGRQLSG